jgi:uncharacterized repeat protein (TIGR03803 family)
MKRTRSLATSHAALLVVSLVIVVLAPSALAQSKYRTLHRFTGGQDGSYSTASLILDAAGSLYGTTQYGGALNQGTVFKLTPSQDGGWKESVLYSFRGINRKDGANPIAGVIFDGMGNLYGTTVNGGIGSSDGGGTVFKLTPNSDGSWTESVLHRFCPLANCRDGMNPGAGLLLDKLGNLYGTTLWGGVYRNGVVFRLTPNSDGSWQEKTIHNFGTGKDGQVPEAGLTFDQVGNLYGTTYFGGAYGTGVVFKLIPNSDGSWKENVLYNFTVGKGGGYSRASLIFDQAGNLYGTTVLGGNLNCDDRRGCGTVFQLTQNQDGSWNEHVLYRFRDAADGGFPQAGLAFDQAGNLYGTTSSGGDAHEYGVVFKLTPNSNGRWKEISLHRFFDHPGALPAAGVILDVAGHLYGTTPGFDSGGCVFEIAP